MANRDAYDPNPDPAPPPAPPPPPVASPAAPPAPYTANHGGGGHPAPPAAAPPSAAPPPPANIDDYVRQTYGYMAWALAVPELRAILEQAASQHLGTDEIMGLLQKTAWWQQHNSVQRQWIQTKESDPAEYQRQMAANKSVITAEARKIGLTLDDGILTQMADDFGSNGWNSQQLDAALYGQLTRQASAGTPNFGGDVAANAVKVHQMASDWLLGSLPDQAVNDWAMRLATNQANDGDFTAYLQNMARGKFPELAKSAIDQGISPGTYLAPMKAEAARLLEIDPNSIDWDDPKWQKVLQVPDQATGPRVMTFPEMGQYVRSMPEYDHTSQAVGAAAQFDLMIGKTMGAIKQ